jgi:hypothetical protein
MDFGFACLLGVIQVYTVLYTVDNKSTSFEKKSFLGFFLALSQL